jgi:hypothetical protein
VIGPDIPHANVVAHDDDDVGLLGLRQRWGSTLEHHYDEGEANYLRSMHIHVSLPLPDGGAVTKSNPAHSSSGFGFDASVSSISRDTALDAE